MIRVVLVDDHPIVRRGLREVLSAEPDIVVVGQAVRSEEVLPLLSAHPTDIVLLDISIPGRGGLEILEDLRRHFPTVRVLVLSTHGESQYAVRSLRAGAAGYLTKNSAADELVIAIREVIERGRYISEAVATVLADFAQTGGGPAHLNLSSREVQILRLLTEGHTVSEIAAQLALSVKTISTYRVRLSEKLGARTTADLVRYALEHRLFDSAL